MIKEFKNFGTTDPHKICKKLGKTMAHRYRNPDYFYRCRKCEVSYSDKEKKYFFREKRCPCCHVMLRRRKTTNQKKMNSLI